MIALWLEDEPAEIQSHLLALRASGIQIVSCSTMDEALEHLAGGESFDSIITDLVLADGSPAGVAKLGGLDFATKAKELRPSTPIVAVSAFPSVVRDRSAVFDKIFSKLELDSPEDSLLHFIQKTIACKIATAEGLDEKFVEEVLRQEDFQIVSNLEQEGIRPGSPRFPRFIEISHEINDLILRQASRSPNILWEMDDRRFEEICATILCREGFRVHLTAKAGDGGYDLMAFNHNGFLTSLYLVECKRWHPEGKKVGVPIVRQLNGVVEQLRAHGGVLITTADFTLPAKQFASDPNVRIDLVDFLKLKSWINKVSKQI